MVTQDSIAIDTPILIYAVKSIDAPDPYGWNQSARELTSQRDTKKRVIVPAMCVAEFMQGTPLEIRAQAYRDIESWGIIAGFEANAVNYAALIGKEITDRWKQDKAMELDSQLAKTSRQVLKMDIYILATAIAHGANTFYTNNVSHFANLTLGLIKVEGLKQPEPTLFDQFLPKA